MDYKTKASPEASHNDLSALLMFLLKCLVTIIYLNDHVKRNVLNEVQNYLYILQVDIVLHLRNNLWLTAN